MASSFDWSGYLKLAEELGKRTDEASLRSAISRAYYYVYHLALKRAQANNFEFVKGGMHTQLWRVFSESPELDCKMLGTITSRMMERRTRADYNNIFTRISEEVPDTLADAQSFAVLFSKTSSTVSKSEKHPPIERLPLHYQYSLETKKEYF